MGTQLHQRGERGKEDLQLRGQLLRRRLLHHLDLTRDFESDFLPMYTSILSGHFIADLIAPSRT